MHLAAETPGIPESQATRPGSAGTRAWAAPVLLAAIVVVRFVVILRVGLFSDEAYYWEWSRHLALSYYDHPPAVAYAIALSTSLLGRTRFAVHLPAFVFALLTSAVLYRLARDLFPGRRAVAWWAVLAANVSPLFGIGAVFTTPDAPCTFFWVLATWLVWRATHGAPRAWYLAGAAVGAGLLSKYTTVLLPVAVAAYLASRRQRHWWRRHEPWVAALIAAALATPILLWNAQHGWASLSYQLVDRHLGPFQPLPTLRRFLVSQQALSPLLWAVCMVALARSAVLARRGSDEHAFLVAGSATVLAFFGVFALHTWVNPNWTGLAYVPLLVSAADLVDRRHWAIRIVPLAVAALMTAALYVQGLWLPFPITGPNDVAGDLHGWDELAVRVRSLRAGMPDPERTFVYARRFQYAALAAFHVGDGVEVTRLGTTRDAYDDWRDDARLAGRDAILFGDSWQPPAPYVGFRACQPAGDLPIVRGGRTVRTFLFWRCRSYRP